MSWPVAVLIAGIAFGAAAQGAFFRTQIIIIVAIAAAAALLVAGRNRDSLSQAISPLTLTFVGIAASAVLSAWIAGYPSGANGVVLVMAGLVCASFVAVTASRRQQESLVTGLVIVSVLVVGVGVAAVLTRNLSMATPAGGAETVAQFWRAASTFTYPNAEAGFLILPATVAMSRAADPAGGWQWRAAAALLLFGIATTASRGGVVGIVAAVVVLFLISDRWALIRSSWSILIGAGVAFACLAPSLPLQSAPHTILAVVGVIAGLLVAQLRSRRNAGIVLALVAASGIVLAALILPSAASDVARISAIRLYPGAIPFRQFAWAVAIEAFLRSPVLGIGPGHFFLRFDTPGVTRYVDSHNEYLQLLAEQGLVGLTILVLGLFRVLVGVLRSRPRNDWLWAGLLAGIAGLAVHSGADFLWHVTVIPLVAAVALGILTSDRQLRVGATNE